MRLTIVEHGRFPIPPTGTFESGPPFCAAGSWRDTNDRALADHQVTYDRVHRCDDGSGTLVVRTTTLDHLGVAAATWTGTGRIIAGTGAYERLRGSGTMTGVREDAAAFTDTWTATVGFDDVAPAVSIGAVQARRLPGAARAYALTVPFTARDDVAENAVGYELRVVAGSTLARRSGTVSGASTVTFARIKVPKAARRLDLTLNATDPLGNVRTVTKAVTLPRP